MAKAPIPQHVIELIKTYQKAQLELINTIAKYPQETTVTAYRKRVLASVNEELRVLNEYATGWAEENIPIAYKKGVADTYEKFRELNIEVGKIQINTRVLKNLVNNATGMLIDANNYVGRMINDEIRKVSLEVIAEKVATGSTVKEAQAKLVKRLSDNGVAHIVDKRGRSIRLESYAETVARTTTAEATNKGAINAVTDLGEDLVRMTWHNASCPICAPLEGRIYSISGKSKEYPPLSEALPGGRNTPHPNCFIDAQVPIFTSKGWKRIIDIEVGDLVLSHKGKFRKVTCLHRNIGRPKIVKITINGTNNNALNCLTVTAEHPLLVNGEWKNAIDVKIGDKVRVLSQPCEVCGKPTTLNNKTCSKECAVKLICKNRDTQEWRDKLSVATSKQMKAGYANGTIIGKDRLAKARLVTNQMIKDGTHPLLNPENQMKGQRELGKRNYGKTWIEEKVGWYLKEKLNLEIESQFPIPQAETDVLGRVRYYYADFLIKDHKIVIECDGSYWHQDKVKDDKRQRHIESLGYTVIRFTGEQIKENLAECGEEVLRVLKNHKGEYAFFDTEITDLKISDSKRTHTLYNFSVDKDESYIAKGFVVHNCRHRFVPYFAKYDDDAEKNKTFSNRPFEIGKQEQAKVDAYYKAQKEKAALNRVKKQWQEARLVAPDETPKTLSAYTRLKSNNPEEFKEQTAKQ